ncbi:hypothetical protein WNY58_09070 [Neptuniibacter pectenicola]|jgi:hypothetical protein|uniref:Sulfatase-modifying factor enzyme 1 n=1 Tax=Neptuniibacter pectenicola TaxID=1806669 RepID=A0ABU9TS44_9GAMM
MKSSVRYLPTKKFHILPICGLAPDELKESARSCSLDRENVKLTTLQNLLANSLGIKEGFSGYRDAYEKRIMTFLVEHGLSHKADLIAPRLPKGNSSLYRLTVEQVSDRLFCSGKGIPSRLFTGYDFDFHARYDNAQWECNQRLGRVLYETKEKREDIEKELLQQAFQEPETEVEGCDVSLRNFVIAGMLVSKISPSFNLMGDMLVEPVRDELVVSEKYYASECDLGYKATDQELCLLSGKLFRAEIDSDTKGWVDVIPFNECLIFLKGRNGEYDFVIKGLRSDKFEHQLYEPYLKRSDIPSQMNEEYHFKRWYYFAYQGWRERDEHVAEQAFYDNGGDSSNYPGLTNVQRMYFEKLGVFRPIDVKDAKKADLPFSIYPVQLDSHCLYVSELISIAELGRFTNQNPEYYQAREGLCEGSQLDCLLPMNMENPNLPAAVTWFDACAYMSYIERTYGVPVRLLRVHEYQALRIQGGDDYSSSSMMPLGTVAIDDTDGVNRLAAFPFMSDGLLEFFEPSGESLGSHPKYMDEERFQNLGCKFVDTLKYSNHPSGLKFVDSDSFCEWLFENAGGRQAACVRSKSLSSIYGTPFLERDLFPATSTGKYKHVKVGFRVCFAAAN